MMRKASEYTAEYIVPVQQYAFDDLSEREAIETSERVLSWHGMGHFVVAGWHMPEDGEDIDETEWLFTVFRYLN